MAILWGDTGKVSYGTYRETTFSYPTMKETTGLNIVLPSLEPEISQISYTVQESDLISFSGNIPSAYDIVPLMYICGKIGVASATINYRLLVNGVSIIQSNHANQTANNYFTYTIGRYVVVKVGDIISVSLWSNQPDVVVNYHCFTTSVTRIQLAPINAILKDVKFGVATIQPNPTQCPVPYNTASTQPFVNLPSNLTSSSISIVNSISSSYTMYALMQDPIYKIGRCSYGDTSNGVVIINNASSKFQPYRNYMPTTISFREIYT